MANGLLAAHECAIRSPHRLYPRPVPSMDRIVNAVLRGVARGCELLRFCLQTGGFRVGLADGCCCTGFPRLHTKLHTEGP